MYGQQGWQMTANPGSPEEAARQKDLKIDTVRDWLADIHLRPLAKRGGGCLFCTTRNADRSGVECHALSKLPGRAAAYATLILVAHNIRRTAAHNCPLPARSSFVRLPARWWRMRCVMLNLTEADAALLAAWAAGASAGRSIWLKTPTSLERLARTSSTI